ncbi:hypothetical protein M1D53_11545 [Bacillus sp. PK9-021]
MKKTITIFLITLIYLTLNNNLEAKALSFPNLPISEKSEQWLVEITNDENGPNLMKSKKGLYHTYSMNIKNIGKSVRNVKVQAFRNEPNSITKYGLFEPTEPPQLAERGGHDFHFSNFGLSEKATDLLIVINWKESESNREYQETFTFHQK